MVSELEQFFIASHEKFRLADLGQDEQVTILRIRRNRSGTKILPSARFNEKGEVPKARREQFGSTGTKPRPEKWTSADFAEFLDERVASYESELFSLPSIEEFGRRAQRRQ